ncbi:hypothetical protein BDV95DRAFT_157941 [Massariosphaeria phaeospora]|uniref:Zn(2)-C6 fungal-type domain-containing protein n=1 Tax=Massariosphaeria phaeospora TaxID=100035 RepID=A0A7C8I191_9PLEO|nr:hypothetical protein BDV95DRAFT_157941 [Massariosphaeria phaeospora]
MTRNLFPARLRMSHQNRRLNNSYRRNGKLQSCEPCRKAKLRCDHMMPTCGRCARRNKPEECSYHPAPLTKSTTIPTPEATRDEERTSPVLLRPHGCTRHTEADYLVDTSDTTHMPQPRVTRASSLPAQPGSSLIYGQQTIQELRRPLPENHIRSESTLFQNDAAFMHHAAVLAEIEASIGIMPPNPDMALPLPTPPAYIDKGAAVLTLLKDLPIMMQYIEKWFSFARGVIMIEPMVKIWTSGVWSTWHKVLEGQKPIEIRSMSEKIWENTAKPLSSLLNRHTTPREFCAMVTGEHLRWEVVGIIVTLVALLALTLQDGDPIFCSHDEPPVNRIALALKAHNASEMCVALCTDFGLMNDLFLWLLYENTVVYCSMRTKGSYQNWVKTGSMSTAVVGFGLHEEIKVDDNTPFFIAEFRKRLFVCVYENDKYSSAYTGRPPRLTRHYCRLQLPLDLTDAQTMSDGLDLENVLSELDAEGWNQRNQVQRCTFARIEAFSANFLEEILEISLGMLPTEEIIRRAADIEAREIETYEGLPPFLRIDDQNLSEHLRQAPYELLFLAYIKLGHLGHHFLLQRALVKKVGVDATKLLAICRETFSFILVLANNRDCLREFQVDLTQMFCINGVPAAAVIAVELLHQEQDPSSLSAMTNPLPRSDTIQDLSAFVACLGAIRPENNSFLSCTRGRKFLKKILDTILDPTPLAANTSTEGLGDTSFTTPLFQTGNDGEFMRWLENMEWEQDSWINFNN